jgi:hypothetical protein
MRCAFATAFCCLLAVLCVLVTAQPGSCAAPPPYVNYLIPCGDDADVHDWGPKDDPTHFDRVNEKDGETTTIHVGTTATVVKYERYDAQPPGGAQNWPYPGYHYINMEAVVWIRAMGRTNGLASFHLWTYVGWDPPDWQRVILCQIAPGPSGHWVKITSPTKVGSSSPDSTFELHGRCVRPCNSLQLDEVWSGHWNM